MRIFNADYIIQITVNDKEEHPEIGWYEEVKSKWYRSGYKAGFYDHDLVNQLGLYTKEDLENGKYIFNNEKLIVEGKRVFTRPYVEILFSHKLKKIKKFDTYNQALEFAESIAKYIPRKITNI